MRTKSWSGSGHVEVKTGLHEFLLKEITKFKDKFNQRNPRGAGNSHRQAQPPCRFTACEAPWLWTILKRLAQGHTGDVWQADNIPQRQHSAAASQALIPGCYKSSSSLFWQKDSLWQMPKVYVQECISSREISKTRTHWNVPQELLQLTTSIFKKIKYHFKYSVFKHQHLEPSILQKWLK